MLWKFGSTFCELRRGDIGFNSQVIDSGVLADAGTGDAEKETGPTINPVLCCQLRAFECSIQ